MAKPWVSAKISRAKAPARFWRYRYRSPGGGSGGKLNLNRLKQGPGVLPTFARLSIKIWLSCEDFPRIPLLP
jgi:hypothetical protein